MGGGGGSNLDDHAITPSQSLPLAVKTFQFLATDPYKVLANGSKLLFGKSFPVVQLGMVVRPTNTQITPPLLGTRHETKYETRHETRDKTGVLGISPPSFRLVSKADVYIK